MVSGDPVKTYTSIQDAIDAMIADGHKATHAPVSFLCLPGQYSDHHGWTSCERSEAALGWKSHRTYRTSRGRAQGLIYAVGRRAWQVIVWPTGRMKRRSAVVAESFAEAIKIAELFIEMIVNP